jgi:hypothetical protein
LVGVSGGVEAVACVVGVDGLVTFGVGGGEDCAVGVVGEGAGGEFELFLAVVAGGFAVEGVVGAVLAEAVGVAGDDDVGVGVVGGSGEVAEGVFDEEGAASSTLKYPI